MSPLERTCSLVRSIVNLVFSGAAQTCCMRIRTQRRVKLVWHRHSYHVPPSDISLSFPAYDFRQIKSALACASLRSWAQEHFETLFFFFFFFFFTYVLESKARKRKRFRRFDIYLPPLLFVRPWNSVILTRLLQCFSTCESLSSNFFDF